jgi:hypothetical protein
MRGSAFFRCFDTMCERGDLASMAAHLVDPANHEAVHTLHAIAPVCDDPDAAVCALVVFVLLQEPREGNDLGTYHQTSIRFVRSCAPQTMLRWSSHMNILVENSRVVSVQVSNYLYRVICAAEDLFGVSGHLVRREE